MTVTASLTGGQPMPKLACGVLLGALFAPALSRGEPPEEPDPARVEEAIKLHASMAGDKRTVGQIKKDNAMIRAAAKGDATAVRQALKDGSPVNARYVSEQIHPYGDNNYTALMRASTAGRVEVVKLLIESKADVNVERNGENSLYMAVLANRDDVVKVLVRAGAEGDPKQIRLTDQLIRAACRNPDEKPKGSTIEGLLESGADVNGADPRGFTPLMYAANLGLVENVKLLLKNGADMTLRSKHGDTALSLAERPGRYAPEERRQVVEVLKAHAARKK